MDVQPATACQSDTAILVQSEQQCNSNGLHQRSRSGHDDDDDDDATTTELGDRNSFALELNSTVMGLKFSGGIPFSMDSPSDCTTLSSLSTLSAAATPLDQKHRFHLFFASHPSDDSWVSQIVQKLENQPYNFKCCHTSRDFDKAISQVQNILVSIMLAQRIVVVLSPAFLEESWPEYEESIAHVTSLSQRRQRVVPVMLGDCDIPDALKVWKPLDAATEGFWDELFRALHVDGFPFSESMLTVRSFSHQYAGFQNGHILCTVKASIEGFCRSRLLFDYEDVPEALMVNDVALTREEFSDLIRVVGREDVGKQLSWLFSALPTVSLGVLFVLWCVTFILIIFLYPDNLKSTLPVRLCVFCLPAAFIVVGCALRFKTLRTRKEEYSMGMFSRSVQMNKVLYNKSKPVIMATARTHDDIFHIYFIYFDRTDCIERIKVSLSHCSDEEHLKLSKLIEVYTLNSSYLEAKPLAVRLGVMMGAAYAINLIYKRIPHSLEQRHTRRRQCLCQFIEEFLAAYLPHIRQQSDIVSLRDIFTRYLNCQFKPDPILLRTLGICQGGEET